MSKRPIRIANFSGAIGDWVPAFAAAVRGEHVDVVVGDYLAEVTMAMVVSGYCARSDPGGISSHYVDIFLNQLVPELEQIEQRGIKVVVNAGAFNPAGLADAIKAAIAEKGLSLRVAYVTGDNLFPRLSDLASEGQVRNIDTGLPLGPLADQIVCANAYIGGWGITEALVQGADIVICGRVTDASLVTGPAAWWHGWQRDDWDRLAGAIAAGHVIECGPQVTGGQFSGFLDVGTPIRLGHPIAEIDEDGSCVITKRQADHGSVNIDTVTAQLVYEIQGPDYLNPDVVAHFDSVQLLQEAPNRVRMSGVAGRPPPETTKLGCFYPNGWRLAFLVFVTAPDIDEKVEWYKRQIGSVVETLDLDEFHFDVIGRPAQNPATKAEATVAVRVAASSQDKTALQKLQGSQGGFAMGGVPGIFGAGSSAIEARVDFWPGLVRQDAIKQQVAMDDGRVFDVDPVQGVEYKPRVTATQTPSAATQQFSRETRTILLGDIVHARAGDKGANAYLGVWARQPLLWNYMQEMLTPGELSRLLNLKQDVRVERFEFDNINGLLFALHGYFNVSGSGTIAFDGLGKAIGEYLRALEIQVPVDLCNSAQNL